MARIEAANLGHEAALLARHANLEDRIATETSRPQPDHNLISELKRAKLKIKDNLNIA